MALLFLQASVANKLIYSFLVVSNVSLFAIINWIAVKGIGIPRGAVFSLIFAVVFVANYCLTSQTYGKFSSSDWALNCIKSNEL